MYSLKSLKGTNENAPIPSILIFLGIVLLFMVISNIIAIGALFLFVDMDMKSMGNLNGLLKNSENGWYGLMVMQGIVSFFSFIGAAWFYWTVIEKKSLSDFNFKSFPKLTTLMAIFILQVLSIPIVGYLGEFNQNIELPESFKALENSFKAMESQMAELTEFLIDITGFGQYIIAFIVVAIFAGVGEELSFRGILLRKLKLLFKNVHVAIIVTAIIFSAIHFQPYGFLPRMLLGVLFGYFYLWTGNIWVPILAHIFNNGLAVTFAYLSKLNFISEETANIDKVSFTPALVSFAIFVAAVWWFNKTIFNSETHRVPNES